MMASPSELSLEFKPQSYSMLLKSFADHQNQSVEQQASQKLEEYLHRLEEERLKIDAFKRELPLCMQLLTNAMDVSRQQLQSYKENNSQAIRPALEEFIPLKHSNSNSNPDGIPSAGQKPAVVSDKANWMISAQLWSQAGDQENRQLSTLPKSEADNNVELNGSPKLGLDTKQRNGGGGAFLPFAKERNSSMRAIAELGLGSGEREREREREERRSEDRENSDKLVGKAEESQTTTTSANTQAQRKARRCWSPDLHRRFVNALQMLGGSQVATPKQIRELMKVDGLTNDEVKSHLQKYRLHTRRPSCPNPQTPGASTPQLVVLGGIWVPPEYAAAHGGGPAIYGAHPNSQVSAHYCSPSPMVSPVDFYAPQPQPTAQGAPHLRLHHPGSLLHPGNHQQFHVYKTSSHTQTHSSPESDAQAVGRDRSESIEDGKSESESGGENNGEEKNRLATLRDDCNESNGSEITLKF